MSKVLFLDVDGVLNQLHSSKNFEPSCLKQLARIIEETKVQIVLSSTWRVSATSTALLHKEFEKYGIPKIHDRTLSLTTRDVEITRWLDDHKDQDIVAWAALDDMALLSLSAKKRNSPALRIKGHFIRTDGSKGVTKKNADDIIQILNGKPSVTLTETTTTTTTTTTLEDSEEDEKDSFFMSNTFNDKDSMDDGEEIMVGRMDGGSSDVEIPIEVEIQPY